MTIAHFDRAMLARLKEQYAAALEAAHGDTNVVFDFEGNVLVIGYAKYLIEYLETKFNRK